MVGLLSGKHEHSSMRMLEMNADCISSIAEPG